MSGRWHQSITMPDGERVTADFRDPITEVMRRAYVSPELSDLAAIMAFYEANRQQVAACQAGECDHDV